MIKVLIIALLIVGYVNALSIGYTPSNLTLNFDNYTEIKVQFRFFNQEMKPAYIQVDFLSDKVAILCNFCGRVLMINPLSSEIKGYTYGNVTFYRPEKTGKYNITLKISIAEENQIIEILDNITAIYRNNSDKRTQFITPSLTAYGVLAENAFTTLPYNPIKKSMELIVSFVFFMLGLMLIIGFWIRERNKPRF